MQKAEKVLLAAETARAKALRQEGPLVLEKLEEDQCGWTVVSKQKTTLKS